MSQTTNDRPDRTDRPDQPSQPDLPDWLEDLTGDAPRDHGKTTGTGDADPHDPAVVEQKLSPVMVTLILVAMALLGIVGYALYERNKSTPTTGPAPDFDVTAYDVDRIAMPGARLSLDTLENQVIVVNFWASYCIPCQAEAPMFERLWTDYRDRGVVFLGINTGEPEKDAVDYLIEYAITYPNAPDHGGKMEDDYRITGIPETFVLNGDGEIVKHFISTPKENELRAAIDQALGS
ncbi:MAG: TlpA family protein disulfide reductase [Anaerolineae bacterium]|nr:TlpA family protein disulfide reductase [Anaerolineae bacterium]